jgi:DNA polymerase-3 subunit delta
MAPSKGSDLKSLAAGWSRGTFHSVYLFAGPDLSQKEEAVKLLIERFLPGDASGMNVDKFDGETADAAAIINALQTLPFFGGRRLILVRRALELAATEAGRLADALRAVPSGNCLVLLWDEKADARSVLVQAAISAGAVLTFWAPFEDQLPRWIQERAQGHGKSMTPAAARALLESVGPNLQDLSHEVEKLSLYVKDRPAVDLADVQALGSGNRTLQVLEFDRAFWRKDRAKALSLMEVLRAQGQTSEGLLAQVVRIYQRLMMGKALASDKSVSREEMWNRLWIRTRQPQEEFLAAVSSHSWDELMEVLEDLLSAERSFKTGRADADTGLTLMVSRLTGK